MFEALWLLMLLFFLLVVAAAYFLAAVEGAVAVNDVASLKVALWCHDVSFVAGAAVAIKAVAVVAHGSPVLQPITAVLAGSAAALGVTASVECGVLLLNLLILLQVAMCCCYCR
jgi:hypothetical protein